MYGAGYAQQWTSLSETAVRPCMFTSDVGDVILLQGFGPVHLQR